MTIDLWKVLSLSLSFSLSLSHSLLRFLRLSFSLSLSWSLFLGLSFSVSLSLSFFLYLSFSLLAPSGSSQLSHACFYSPFSRRLQLLLLSLFPFFLLQHSISLSFLFHFWVFSSLTLSIYSFCFRSFYFLHTSHFLLVLNICSHTQIWPRTYDREHSLSLHNISSSLH